MLFSKILMSKKVFTISTGEVILDLISSTFKFGENRTSAGVIIVNNDEIMRPDLVAERIYSDQGNWDAILKFNGVSNPFSLDEGEVILAPPFKTLGSTIGPPTEVFEKGKEPAKKNETEIITPKTKKDKKRLESLRTKVSEVVPPNVNLTGAKNIKVENGVITFGGDMTQQGGVANTNNTLSRARVQDQLRNSNNF
jgi:hypothetical protein